MAMQSGSEAAYGPSASSADVACRASWPHAATRLGKDRNELDTWMRMEIVRALGFEDEVVFDMLSRHLARAVVAQDLQLDSGTLVRTTSRKGWIKFRP